MKEISGYLDQVGGFESLTQKEQVKLVSYFYMITQSLESFTSAAIKKCFEDHDLRVPANITHELNRLASEKPPVLIKKGNIYSFQRTVRKNLDDRFGTNKTIETSRQNVNEELFNCYIRVGENKQIIPALNKKDIEKIFSGIREQAAKVMVDGRFIEIKDFASLKIYDLSLHNGDYAKGEIKHQMELTKNVLGLGWSLKLFKHFGVDVSEKFEIPEPVGSVESESHSVNYIGVITASPHEFKSIKALLKDVKQLNKSEYDSVTYYAGILEENNKRFDIVLPYPIDMGIASAVTSTTKVISIFRPKYLFMVGIAAGNRNVNNVGDILIAEKSLNYNEVVEIEKKDSTMLKKFMQNQDSINKHLKTLLSQFSDSELIKNIEESFPEKEKIQKPLKCSIGLMVTGSSLVRSQSKVDEINQSYLNVIGLDMETNGFYYAAAHNLREHTPYFVSIKSVSDFGDNTNQKLTTDERRRYALYTSSNAFKLFVLNYIPSLD